MLKILLQLAVAADWQGVVVQDSSAMTVAVSMTGYALFIYCTLGNTYLSQGHYATAIKYHTQHLTMTKEVGDRTGRAEQGRGRGRRRKHRHRERGRGCRCNHRHLRLFGGTCIPERVVLSFEPLVGLEPLFLGHTGEGQPLLMRVADCSYEVDTS